MVKAPKTGVWGTQKPKFSTPFLTTWLVFTGANLSGKRMTRTAAILVTASHNRHVRQMGCGALNYTISSQCQDYTARAPESSCHTVSPFDITPSAAVHRKILATIGHRTNQCQHFINDKILHSSYWVVKQPPIRCCCTSATIGKHENWCRIKLHATRVLLRCNFHADRGLQQSTVSVFILCSTIWQ